MAEREDVPVADDFDIVLYVIEHVLRSAGSIVQSARQHRRVLRALQAEETSNARKAA